VARRAAGCLPRWSRGGRCTSAHSHSEEPINK
jgi:hypothetical protein